jgi:hypothetical protein
MKVDKDLVAKLRDENITHKEYRQIIEQINNKINEIWRWICAESNREIDWWSFRNDISYGHGNGSSGGEFDPVNDNDWIDITGDVENCNLPGYLYNDGFPTEFLWENYKKVVKAHLKECRKREKEESAAKQQSNDRYVELVASIKKKLTAEELKVIRFKYKAKR